MTSRCLGHRAPLLWLVLPYMAGLAAGKAGVPAPLARLLVVAALSALFAILAGWRGSRFWGASVCLAMVLAGIASYTFNRHRLPAWEGMPPREARLTLRIDRVFPQADPRKAAGLATVIDAGSRQHELIGQHLHFSLSLPKGAPAPIRSSAVAAVGLLTPLPLEPAAGSFEEYLDRAGINFRYGRGLVLEQVEPPTRYREFCERGAARLNELLSAGVAQKRPELAAVFRAMMLGQKYELSDEQDTLFMHSGTMHLFAINGIHIGVVAKALGALFALLRIRRPYTALLTLGVLWLDVDMTGRSPSAVRAFMLVACYNGAFVFRLPPNGLAALSTAALLVLLGDPMALFGASFQMSYGVVLTLLVFGLPVAEHLQARWQPFRRLPKAVWNWRQHILAWVARELAGAIGIGTAAALVSAVTGIAFFNFFTPGAFLANLVLVPLAMVVIIAGFASVVSGLAGAAGLGALFNHSALVVLWAIDALTRLGLRAPGMWWPAHWREPWMANVALAALLASVLAGYAANWNPKRGRFWPPFIIVALALAIGVKFG